MDFLEWTVGGWPAERSAMKKELQGPRVSFRVLIPPWAAQSYRDSEASTATSPPCIPNTQNFGNSWRRAQDCQIIS